MNNNIFHMLAASFSKHVRTELFPAETLKKRTLFQLGIFAILVAILLFSHHLNNNIFGKSIIAFGILMIVFGIDHWINTKDKYLKKTALIFCFMGLLFILNAISPGFKSQP